MAITGGDVLRTLGIPENYTPPLSTMTAVDGGLSMVKSNIAQFLRDLAMARNSDVAALPLSQEDANALIDDAKEYLEGIGIKKFTPPVSEAITSGMGDIVHTIDNLFNKEPQTA